MTFCVCYLNSYKTTQDDNGLDRKPTSKSSIESMYFVVVIIISVFYEEKVSFYGGGNLVKQHTRYSNQISATNKIWITFFHHSPNEQSTLNRHFMIVRHIIPSHY